MNKSKLNLKYSMAILVVSIILTALGIVDILPKAISTLLETAGISLLVSSTVYVVLYSGDVEHDFVKSILKVIHENRRISDYLVDFAFDCTHIKDKRLQYERIIKLYEQIHSVNLSAGEVWQDSFHGKREQVMKLYDRNCKTCINLIDFVVERRNHAVLLLHDLDKIEEKQGKLSEEDLKEFINDTIVRARGYSTILENNCVLFSDLLGLECENKSKYITPL